MTNDIVEVPDGTDHVFRVTAGAGSKIRIRAWFRAADGSLRPGMGGLTVSISTLKAIVAAVDRGRS